MTTIWFINKFEGVCGSKTSVQRLRSHPSFNAFMSRWSLPVYFQIRFVDLFLQLADMSVYQINHLICQEICNEEVGLHSQEMSFVLYWVNPFSTFF